MPVEFEFSDRIIVLRMIDVYEQEDIRKALLQGLADPGVVDATGLLFDVSHSRSLRTRSPDDLVAMAYFIATHADSFAKRVALVGFDDFPFGMMRMGQVALRREGVTAEVFREDANARRWLLQAP